MINRKNEILEICIETPAIWRKPNNPATSAMTKNTKAQYNIFSPLCFIPKRTLVPSHKNFRGFDPSFSAQLRARARQLDASCRRSPRFAGQKNLGANSPENFYGQVLEAKLPACLGHTIL